MNLIESYLIKENYLEANKKSISDDGKLELFFKIFTELELKYNSKIEDMKRLELEHKDELIHLENHIHKVKELTEEREQLTNDFRDENNELRAKIRGLERELESIQEEYEHLLRSKSLNRHKSDASSDDELSEATIEILILEGFGNIVASPNHEKIAAILSDRAKLLEELNNLKRDIKSGDISTVTKISTHTQTQFPEEYENIIINLKNEKNLLLCKLDELENQMIVLKQDNQSKKNEINKLNDELNDLKRSKNSSKEINNDFDDNVSTNSSSDENAAIIEASKFEIAKLKEDNLNLKMEIDKLYDEIGSFEIENKQLKDDNKKLFRQIEEISSASNINQTNLDEIKKLKDEIDDLNNELDELIQYKLNYEKLKSEHDKLKLEQIEILNIEAPATIQAMSPKRSASLSLINNNSVSSLVKAVSPKKSHDPGGIDQPNKEKLELEWIRGENEKLLLELEKVQSKLDERLQQYNELKQIIAEKDEQMKEFIQKYESKETTQDDVLELQKKILDLEQLINQEREDHSHEIESNEERQKDLLKRNDHLWSQLTKLEKNYKDAIDVIKQQTSNIETLEGKLKEVEKAMNDLREEKDCETLYKEKVIEKNENLNKVLEETKTNLRDAQNNILKINKERDEENETNRIVIEDLNYKITKLKEQISGLDQEITNLKLDIDSLNKEKAFIITQNENAQQKMMQDYLNLQEKHTNINYLYNRATKENTELSAVVQKNESKIAGLESEKTELNQALKQETREKLDSLERIKHLDSTIVKNSERISDLQDKLHKVEIQKTKLEAKAKELESLQVRCEQIYNELNDKRETLSQVLEKNGKLEFEISHLEHQLNDTKHSLIQSESVISELNHFKSDTILKSEEIIKLKHEFENEKKRREKAEQKVEELKDEYKKLKQKLNKFQQENAELKHDNIDAKNQLQGVKSKLDFISDKSHTELEKNTALQDELSETKKKLELIEVRCNTYSQKFDILLKKYEARKLKHKSKMERLWDYLQRERTKYKDLLSNVQNDINTTKNLMEKENEYKSKQESTFQDVLEEKSKLIATIAEKDSRLRDIKRQNDQLHSKIKYLEEEIEGLNLKIDSTLKERNRYRKELQLNLVGPVSLDILDSCSLSRSTSPVNIDGPNNLNVNSNLVRAISTDPLERSIKSTSANLTFWNDLNASSSWDINYNTSFIKNKDKNLGSKNLIIENRSKFNLDDSFRDNNGRNFDFTNKRSNANGDTLYGGSLATELNSVLSTPRSYR